MVRTVHGRHGHIATLYCYDNNIIRRPHTVIRGKPIFDAALTLLLRLSLPACVTNTPVSNVECCRVVRCVKRPYYYIHNIIISNALYICIYMIHYIKYYVSYMISPSSRYQVHNDCYYFLVSSFTYIIFGVRSSRVAAAGYCWCHFRKSILNMQNNFIEQVIDFCLLVIYQ